MSKRMVDLKVSAGKITSINGYEVGGGGGSYNVAVQSAKQEWENKYRLSLQWNGDFGLKANTAYEVGDQVMMHVKVEFQNKQADPNQILVPINSTIKFSPTTKRLQFGDVIIVLTDRNVNTASYSGTTPDQNYKFITEAYPTYTVLKAGTTGSDVSLSGKSVDAEITYMIYTLGVTKTQA